MDLANDPANFRSSFLCKTLVTFLIATLFVFINPNKIFAAGTVFVTNGSTQIGTFPTAIPNNSYRITTSSLNSASITSISAAFVGSSSATLSPTTGWTQTWSSSADDSNHKISFGWNTSFNTSNYDGVYVGSNTYLTFGSGSSLYSGLSASVPAIPGVHMCAADNSYQRVYYKLDDANTMRIRYEGNNSTSGTVGSPTIVYEAVFYKNQSYFDLHMGSNSRCGGDTTAPTISNVSSDKANGSYRVGEVIDIDVTFSEAVTSTGNVTVTLETGATDRTCTFTVSGSTTGTCNYTVQAGDTSADLTVASISGTIRDTSNNSMSNFSPATNLAANKAIIIDTTAPTVSNVSSSLSNGSYKSGQVTPIQVVFTETVVVAVGTPQITLVTGSPATTAVNYTSGSNSSTLVFNYTVGAGNYTTDLDYSSTSSLALNGATIKDVAGNTATLTLASPGASGSLGANKANVIDNTVPTVTLSSTAPSLTKASPIPVTATFSESVTNFVVGDITVTNGTAGSFSGSGASYTFNVTPTGQGAINISLSSGVAQDSAGNLTTASNTLSRTYDSVVPTVTIATNGNSASNSGSAYNIRFDNHSPTLSLTTNATDPTTSGTISITATFSEAVTGFASDDIDTTNSSVSNFSGSGTTYTFDLTIDDESTATVSVQEEVAQDAATNLNLVSNILSRTYDSTPPGITLTTTSDNPTNISPFSVTATFTENVTNFAQMSIAIGRLWAKGMIMVCLYKRCYDKFLCCKLQLVHTVYFLNHCSLLFQSRRLSYKYRMLVRMRLL